MINYKPNIKWHVEPTDDERADYKRQVQALSNNDLYYDTLDLAGGDDYDGCYTDHGEFVYGLLREELDSRLKAIGFLE